MFARMNSLASVFANAAAIFGSVESTSASMMRVCPAARTFRLPAARLSAALRASSARGSGRFSALRHAVTRPVSMLRSAGPFTFSFAAVRSTMLSLWRILICVWMSARAMYDPISDTASMSFRFMKFWFTS